MPSAGTVNDATVGAANASTNTGTNTGTTTGTITTAVSPLDVLRHCRRCNTIQLGTLEECKAEAVTAAPWPSL